jgi:formylglycine-generating enzyme required for sulfatase activity
MTVTTSRMMRVPAGTFAMGSESFYPDEGPVRRVSVDAFEIDEHPVTNAQFADFVAATGYRTVAERPLDPAVYPGVPTEDLQPGALVFTGSAGPVDLSDWRGWWSWVPGAYWRAPGGPGSTIESAEQHPVVQVSLEDATAYAEWARERLPTEAEWEFASRGGSPDGLIYAWGNEVRVDDRVMANTWQGRFPYLNTGADGWRGTSPVGSFPPNGFGLFDMIGNVWEWTTTYYSARHETTDPIAAGAEERRLLPVATSATTSDSTAGSASGSGSVSACGSDECTCSPSDSRVAAADAARAAASAEPGSSIPRRALKGGSHLCAPEYCLRYRPAARSPQADDSATTHIGFRCARTV